MAQVTAGAQVCFLVLELLYALGTGEKKKKTQDENDPECEREAEVYSQSTLFPDAIFVNLPTCCFLCQINTQGTFMAILGHSRSSKNSESPSSTFPAEALPSYQ